MESNWAAEHLQVIRTLMERSAIYRRALAPVMLMIGLLGLGAGAVGWYGGLDSAPAFAWFWLGVSLLGLGGALVMIRRQAWQAAEPFWSPPTRRVTQAILPALFSGLVAGMLMLLLTRPGDSHQAWWLPFGWMVLYGCGLHAAGFFMPRGMRLFGWLFIAMGCALGLAWSGLDRVPPLRLAHWIMGGFFGGMHLAYGIYLYLTEKGQQTR
jgi:hypothetical protein